MDTVKFLPLGATIQSITIDGVNIVQGFNTLKQYRKYNTPYFGATIGRVANRIANGKINSLNNTSYTLSINDGTNTLHGGFVGWDKKEWMEIESGMRVIPGVELEEGAETTGFEVISGDGEEGFPGDVKGRVWYTVGKEKRADGKRVTVLGMEYEVVLVSGPEETVVNMTNHTYFNLAGTSSAKTITGTLITLLTTTHLPLSSGIPNAPPRSYPGLLPNTPFHLTTTTDLDDCFVLPPDTTDPVSFSIDTRNHALTLNAAAEHPDTGIHLEVLSTEPAFQFYTGKGINVPAVDGLPARGAYSGFAVEPSRYVNAVNEEAWKQQVVLKKGETYGTRIVYKAWKE